MSNESTTSSQTISSVLNEQRLFPPPRKFTEAARIKAADLAALQRRADADPVGYWADLARAEIAWRKLFTQKNCGEMTLQLIIAQYAQAYGPNARFMNT